MWRRDADGDFAFHYTSDDKDVVRSFLAKSLVQDLEEVDTNIASWIAFVCTFVWCRWTSHRDCYQSTVANFSIGKRCDVAYPKVDIFKYERRASG